MFLSVLDNLKSMVFLGVDLPVMNADNGFIDVVALVKASDVVSVVTRVGDGVAVGNDKEVLDADKCIELDMIDVLLPLSQKMIYTGPVPHFMVFVVMILCPGMICTGVVVGVIVFEHVDFVISVLIDCDESNVFSKDDGLFMSYVDEGTCVIWADVLVFLPKNVVFNECDCVPDVFGYASVVS